MITQDFLKEKLIYTPDTGLFTWKVTLGSRAKAGSQAGCHGYGGYVRIIIHGKIYRAHRLAWLYETGELPVDQIDHINGVRMDNRIVNLRVVTNEENSKNRRLSKNSTSGVMGVCWHKSNKKWQAQIYNNGKAIYLGAYDNIEDAISARADAEARYGYHQSHGRKPWLAV